MKLLSFTNKGIYCNPGKFYIDPWTPVEQAVITHAHSDHARIGSKSYICHNQSIPVLKYRLGNEISVTGYNYNEFFELNDVTVSFHPAGHIIGSSQVRVEYQGEVWVASGDYKLMNDKVCEPYQALTCDVFITESTFGLPIFKWKQQEHVFNEINNWWLKNSANGKATVLIGYALGKAQRILQNINASTGKIYTHGAIENLNEIFRANGCTITATEKVSPEISKENYRTALILAPPSAIGTPWLKRFEPYSIGIASGWMALRGARRRKAVDRGFVLSDHSDWDELNQAVKASKASEVYVTHGYTEVFSRWLNENGIKAHAVKTQYQGELAELEINENEDLLL